MDSKTKRKTKRRRGKKIDIVTEKKGGDWKRTKTVTKEGKVLRKKTLYGTGGHPDSEAIVRHARTGGSNEPREESNGDSSRKRASVKKALRQK